MFISVRFHLEFSQRPPSTPLHIAWGTLSKQTLDQCPCKAIDSSARNPKSAQRRLCQHRAQIESSSAQKQGEQPVTKAHSCCWGCGCCCSGSSCWCCCHYSKWGGVSWPGILIGSTALCPMSHIPHFHKTAMCSLQALANWCPTCCEPEPGLWGTTKAIISKFQQGLPQREEQAW